MEKSVVLPDDFEDFAWEVEAKGVLLGAGVRVGERVVQVTFYDPVRLSQDLEEDLRLDGSVSLLRIVVVPKVTEAMMVAAVSRLPDSFVDG